MIRRLAVLAAALLTAAGLLAAAPTPAQADSMGYRWPSKTICVENWATGVRYTAVSAIVHHANTYTNLSIWHRGPRGCSGFANRIGVGQAAFGRNGYFGYTDYPGGATWCKLRSGATFKCFASPVRIRLNVSYSLDLSTWKWTAAHELGHALGLSHVAFTCDTVMRARHSDCRYHPHALSWYDRVGTAAHPGINRIYAW